MIRSSKRRFTKILILINCVLAWCSIFVSMYLNQSQWIAVSAFGLIASIVAYYMEVGHRDLVRLLSHVSGNPINQVSEPMENTDVEPPPQ